MFHKPRDSGVGWYVHVALWYLAGALYWGRFLQIVHMLWVLIEWTYYSTPTNNATGWGIYEIACFLVLAWSHIFFALFVPRGYKDSSGHIRY